MNFIDKRIGKVLQDGKTCSFLYAVLPLTGIDTE